MYLKCTLKNVKLVHFWHSNKILPHTAQLQWENWRKGRKSAFFLFFNHITSKTPWIHSLHFSPRGANFNKKGKTAEDNTKERKCPGFILWCKTCHLHHVVSAIMWCLKKFCKVGLKTHISCTGTMKNYAVVWGTMWFTAVHPSTVDRREVSLYTKIFFLENYFHCCTQPHGVYRVLHLREELVALSIHLTSHCGSLSKQSKRSASNINIWSQSSSCLSKYSQGEGKVAPSQASCCVYYFSAWPLTYRQRKDSCLWKQETSVWIAVAREKGGKKERRQMEGGLKVTGLDPYQTVDVLCVSYCVFVWL